MSKKKVSKKVKAVKKAPGIRRSQSPRRGVAHIPNPRRKPKDPFPYVEVQVPTSEEDISEEEIDGAAPAAESVSDEAISSEKGHEAPQPGGHEKPMTFGSVDGK